MSVQGFEMSQKFTEHHITQSSISGGLSTQGGEQLAQCQEHSTLPHALDWKPTLPQKLVTRPSPPKKCPLSEMVPDFTV